MSDNLIIAVMALLAILLAVLLILLVTDTVHVLSNGAVAIGPYPGYWLCFPSWGACR